MICFLLRYEHIIVKLDKGEKVQIMLIITDQRRRSSLNNQLKTPCRQTCKQGSEFQSSLISDIIFSEMLTLLISPAPVDENTCQY